MLALRSPADAITSAGTTVHDALTGAGDSAGGLPLVGDQLRQWLGQAAGSGTSLREAGTSMADTVETLALTLGLAAAVVPILIVGKAWLVASAVHPACNLLAAVHRRQRRPRPLRPARHGATWRDVR